MGIAQYIKVQVTEFHFMARRGTFILNFTSKPTVALTEPSWDRQDQSYSSRQFKTNTSPLSVPSNSLCTVHLHCFHCFVPRYFLVCGR